MNDQAVHYLILKAVRQAIIALNLRVPAGTILPPAQIYLKKYPTDRGATKPCIVVSYPDREQFTRGTNEDIYCNYPVQLTIVAEEIQNLDVDANANTWLLWREKLVDEFMDEPLNVGDPSIEVYDCDLEPKAIFDAVFFRENNAYLSGLLLRFKTTRPRKEYRG